LVLAACADDNSDSASSGSTASSSGSSDAVKAAQTEVEKYYTSPKDWPGPTSAPKPLPGKTLAVVSSGLQSEGSARPTRAAKEAAEKIGWKATIYDGANQQLKTQAAVNAAVDAKSDAIILVLIDPSTIGDAVQRALDAKIPVATVGVPAFLGGKPARDEKWASIPDASWDLYQQGGVLANYMIWKSNGKVNVFVTDVPDFPGITLGQTQGGLDVFNDKTKCPDCTVEKVGISVSEFFDKIGPAAVAAVQKNPDLQWLYLLDAGLEVQINALDAANLLGDIQGGGFDCNAHNLDFIKNDHGQKVCIAESSQWAAWAAVDAVNRMMQGQPPVTAGYSGDTKGPGENYTLPILVVDKSNVNTLTEQDLADGWQGGIDFRSEYLKLWGAQ
jgi:ribose transport system substrate-binding protein